MLNKNPFALMVSVLFGAISLFLLFYFGTVKLDQSILVIFYSVILFIFVQVIIEDLSDKADVEFFIFSFILFWLGLLSGFISGLFLHRHFWLVILLAPVAGFILAWIPALSARWMKSIFDPSRPKIWGELLIFTVMMSAEITIGYEYAWGLRGNMWWTLLAHIVTIAIYFGLGCSMHTIAQRLWPDPQPI